MSSQTTIMSSSSSSSSLSSINAVKSVMTITSALKSIRQVVNHLFSNVISPPENALAKTKNFDDILSLLPLWVHVENDSEQKEEGFEYFHIHSVLGSELSTYINECRISFSFIHKALSEHIKRFTSNSLLTSRLNSMLIERLKLSTRLCSVSKLLDTCSQALSCQNRLDIASSKDHEQLELFIIIIQRICTRLSLTCDCDVVQDTAKTLSHQAVKHVTIALGSSGDSSCFAVEISASSNIIQSDNCENKAQVVIMSASATFVFGEDEYQDAVLDASLLMALQQHRFKEIEERLVNALKLESFLEINKKYVNIRYSIRQAFLALNLRIEERLDGVMATLFVTPVDIHTPTATHSIQSYTISFVGAHQHHHDSDIEGEHDIVNYVFDVKPPVIMPRALAASLLTSHVTRDKNVGCDVSGGVNLAHLLCVNDAVAVEGIKTHTRLEQDAVAVSRIIIKNIEFAMDGSSVALRHVVLCLQQRIALNTLIQSCFRSSTVFNEHHNARRIELFAEDPNTLTVVVSHKSLFFTFQIFVHPGGEVNVEVKQENEVKDSTYATNVLRKCMSLPLLIKYVLR